MKSRRKLRKVGLIEEKSFLFFYLRIDFTLFCCRANDAEKSTLKSG